MISLWNGNSFFVAFISTACNEGVFKVVFYLKNQFFSLNNQVLSCIISTQIRNCVVIIKHRVVTNEVMLHSVNGHFSCTMYKMLQFPSTSDTPQNYLLRVSCTVNESDLEFLDLRSSSSAVREHCVFLHNTRKYNKYSLIWWALFRASKSNPPSKKKLYPVWNI